MVDVNKRRVFVSAMTDAVFTTRIGHVRLRETLDLLVAGEYAKLDPEQITLILSQLHAQEDKDADDWPPREVTKRAKARRAIIRDMSESGIDTGYFFHSHRRVV